LLLSTHTQIDDAVELFSATASRRISEGGTVLDPKLVVELLATRRRTDPLDALTPRERQVLALMAQGQSNAGIAKTLWITHGAVESTSSTSSPSSESPPPLTFTDASSPPSHSSEPVNLRLADSMVALVLHLPIRVAGLQGGLQEIPP
jgi:hypothetical protein